MPWSGQILDQACAPEDRVCEGATHSRRIVSPPPVACHDYRRGSPSPWPPTIGPWRKGDEATHSPTSWATNGSRKLLAPLSRVVMLSSASAQTCGGTSTPSQPPSMTRATCYRFHPQVEAVIGRSAPKIEAAMNGHSRGDPQRTQEGQLKGLGPLLSCVRELVP